MKPQTDRHRSKVMMLAIDASPAERMEGWMADGSLPNLAALRAKGSFGRIESTADFLAGTPWPTFHTGSFPPEHGWTFYLTWRPDLMRFVRPTQEWQPVDPFYRNFPLDGPRVIAVDVPITYRPKPFNGVELTGWGTHDKICRPSSYPEGLAERVRHEIGPPPLVDELTGPQSARDLLRLRDDMKAAADWHARAGLMLMRENQWDLMMLGFGGVHRAGHKIWNHGGASGPMSEREHDELDDALRQVAMATDKAVGQLIEAAGADARVIVCSLHGMIENYSLFPLYQRMLDRILKRERRDDAEILPRGVVQTIREAIPLALRSRLKDALPYAMQDAMTLFWRRAKPDWSTTKAFMLAGDLEGIIRVNLKGRERDGIVEPGADYDALLDEIAAGFESFRDMDTGDPLVMDIRRGRDIWPDAVQRHYMPDLLLRNQRRSARPIRGFRSERFGLLRNRDVGGYVDGRSGHHIGEGWFIAAGADLPAGGAQPRLHEHDLLATLHALLGQPMAPGMRGQAASALLPRRDAGPA